MRLGRRAVERGGDAGGAIVAALATAAERQPRRRAHSALVPVEHARAEAADAALVLRAVARDHRRGEPVVGIVRGRDRLVEIAERVERGLRAEDLLALIGMALVGRLEAHYSRSRVGR